MNYNCPACQREIYNRRLTRCGFCGAEIPADLRFSADEIAALDAQMAAFEKQRAEHQRAIDAEKERQRKARDAAASLPRIL
jgi:hypothetical protein